ncbi:MAG TPA: hypothetical protein VHR84_14640 [Terriglobales bacterium]|jgi:hypothetical protein|nr:hypothetical protein [Terriglobales bacterium]
MIVSLSKALPTLVMFLATSLVAQTELKPNQTFGYGANRLLKFTYTQNFDCVEQPFNDYNFNGIKAQSDPPELQIPICRVGTQPSINPPGIKGNPLVTTDPLFVLVPMFSTNNDRNPNHAIRCAKVTPGTLCGNALGKALIALFGALPEAFKAKPSVYTQCPDPGLPPGTCTMHASRLDLAPALAALKLIPSPATANVFVPSPNHSHVLKDDDINLPAEWWQVLPVLVLKESDWPSRDGTSGITSIADVTRAIQAGDAIKAPSNFFLFFSSMPIAHDHAQMVH